MVIPASFSHVSNVCPSHSAACGARHGASTGTVAAIALRSLIVVSTSISDGVSAGGIVPS